MVERHAGPVPVHQPIGRPPQLGGLLVSRIPRDVGPGVKQEGLRESRPVRSMERGRRYRAGAWPPAVQGEREQVSFRLRVPLRQWLYAFPIVAVEPHLRLDRNVDETPRIVAGAVVRKRRKKILPFGEVWFTAVADAHHSRLVFPELRDGRDELGYLSLW